MYGVVHGSNKKHMESGVLCSISATQRSADDGDMTPVTYIVVAADAISIMDESGGMWYLIQET